MGKLHSLRRVIERDPQRWIHYQRARPAYINIFGQWQPVEIWSSRHSYRNFVRSVLRRLGYVVQ